MTLSWPNALVFQGSLGQLGRQMIFLTLFTEEMSPESSDPCMGDLGQERGRRRMAFVDTDGN